MGTFKLLGSFRKRPPRKFFLCIFRRTRSIPLPYWYANAGTCGPLQPGWMSRRDTSQWGSAIIVIDVGEPMSRRRGRNWEARLEVMP